MDGHSIWLEGGMLVRKFSCYSRRISTAWVIRLSIARQLSTMWIGPDGVVVTPAMVEVNDSRRLWNLFVALDVRFVGYAPSFTSPRGPLCRVLYIV